MFFVVVPCADVPVTAWINNSVLAISRSFILFHERQIIFDITTVTTVTTRLTVLYTARMVATKSFPAFTQFEAVTQTALWTSCTHVLDLSFRSKSAWCNVILGLLQRSVTLSLRMQRTCQSSAGLMFECYFRVKSCLSEDQLQCFSDDGRLLGVAICKTNPRRKQTSLAEGDHWGLLETEKQGEKITENRKTVEKIIQKPKNSRKTHPKP